MCASTTLSFLVHTLYIVWQFEITLINLQSSVFLEKKIVCIIHLD